MSRTGYYKGYLTYGKRYGKHAGKELQFDIRLIEEEGGTFFGESSDLEGFGQNPSGSELKGVFVKENMVFKKKYNQPYCIDANGETIPDKKSEAPIIQYIGFYKKEKEQYEGDWSMKVPTKLFGFIPSKAKLKGTFVLWIEKTESELTFGR